MLSQLGRSLATCLGRRLWDVESARWTMLRGLFRSCSALAPADPRCPQGLDPSGAGPIRSMTTFAKSSLVSRTASRGRRLWFAPRCPPGEAATSASVARPRRPGHPGSLHFTQPLEGLAARGCGRGFSINNALWAHPIDFPTCLILLLPRHLAHINNLSNTTRTTLVILLFSCIVPFPGG